MIEPIFIKTTSRQYYFDVDNNQIYGPSKDTQGYWHELSHFKDYQLKWYRNIRLYVIQYLNQLAAFSFGLVAIYTISIGNFDPIAWSRIMGDLGNLFLPYCLWTLQEEVRADIYGYYKWIKSKKELKN